MSQAHPGESAPAVEPESIDVTSLVEAADEDEPQLPARSAPSRRRLIALGALLTLTVAAVAVFATTGLPVIREKNATLTIPDRIGDLRLDERATAVATAAYLRDALAADVDLDESVGAVYADSADAARSVLVFGGTGLLWRPDESLDKGFDLLSDDAGRVEGVRSVSPGKLGGLAKCGSATSQAGDIAVCGWADHGSIGLMVFPGRGVDEAGHLFRAVREEVQSR